ncbi:MAG: lamin tail domain-containing protein [Candidatus Promineifilaceae bacterium]
MIKRTLILLMLGLLFTACQDQTDDSSTPADAPTLVVATDADSELGDGVDSAETAPEPPQGVQDVQFSELVVGASGNNNYEFIELYNGSDLPFDLNGHELIYLQRSDRDIVTVATWTQSANIPPHGHYLLAREGQDVGAAPDALFDTPLSNKNGGLALRSPDGEALATISYGADAPTDFIVTNPADAPTGGESIARKLDGDLYQFDAAHNADFALTSSPTPQNSASAQLYTNPQQLQVSIELPDEAQPGSEFSILLRVRNESDSDADNAQLVMPLDASLTPLNLPDYATAADGQIVWTFDTVKAGTALTEPLFLQAPYTVLESNLSGVYALADAFPAKFAEPQPLVVAGGAIPIGIARDLLDTVVTVEGVTTMYTGGFYAGSTSSKFYIEDETGGIQVFADGGIDDVRVGVGEKVQVTGRITLYRDSIEIIPIDNNADIVVQGDAEATLEPTEISVAENEVERELLGRLNIIEGEATRIEEFSFSYEVDLTDNAGVSTLVYIEKDTGVSAETLDLGETYRVTGISEFYSSRRQLKPRFQTDIAQVFPPEVRVTYLSPPNIPIEEAAEMHIIVSNYRPEPLSKIRIAASLPRIATTGAYGNFLSASGNGKLGNDQIVYFASDIVLAMGESISFTFSAELFSKGLATTEVLVTSDNETDLQIVQANRLFVGSNVPIWAIQGEGERSPYVRQTLTTEGIVTGVFPELGGFFIQEIDDSNTATSDGLFVMLTAGEDAETDVQGGDYVLVSGRVRELAGQTTLDASDGEVTIASNGIVLPNAAALDPPLDPQQAAAYFEAREGMLVAINEPAVATAPTTRFGETVFVLAKHGISSVTRDEEIGYLIGVDDGSTISHQSGDTLDVRFAKNEQVASVTGPLAYTFGSYKIEPIEVVKGSDSAEIILPSLDLEDNQLAFATYNVENFFDRFDPHPSSPPKPGRAALATKLEKIAASIVAMDAPAVIGLQEVENLGLLEDLVALETLAPFGYSPYLLEAVDGRGIDVGYLVRDEFVNVKSVTQHPMPDGSLSRHPLVLRADIAGRDIAIINAHLTSLSGGEEATEPIRQAQAAWLAELAVQFQTEGADVAVLGDLNSFWQTSPLDALESAELTHVYEVIPRSEPLPYTYIYEGRTQSLDHILLSDGLFDDLVDVVALHLNANYPLAAADDISAERTSDHDPLIAIFEMDR